MRAKATAMCLSLVFLAGCGSGDSADARVERDVRRGLAQIASGQSRFAAEVPIGQDTPYAFAS